jgi:asparagine synthase (glutamine-hydrolysing)
LAYFETHKIMCGIAGKISFEKFQNFEKEVKDSCDAMAYRGPDNLSVHSIGKACLGHVRLSIIDLSSEANQPFYSEDKRYSIVFNGEIYNFKEVRRFLEANYDIVFKTNSDTEVLLKGFICLGASILDKLRGMWAFVIWDNANDELFIARDRFGEKPLFYHFENNVFSFASNLSGISKLVDEKSLNPKAISELFAYQYISQNESIYRGIKKVLPAQFGVVKQESISFQTYWQVNYHNKIDISFEEAQTKVEEILHSSIQEKLISDVPLGLFLSGGNDSGLVAAIASQYKKSITSITLSTPQNPELDEAKFAKEIASMHGLNYHQVDLEENCINMLPKILGMIEPFADSSIIPTTAVSEKAKKYLKVVLTGDGGDEIFGGYGIPALLNSIKPSIMPLGKLMDFLSNRRFQPGWKYLPKIANIERMIHYGGLVSYCNAMDYEPSNIRQLLFQPTFIRELEIEQSYFPKSIIRAQDMTLSKHDQMLILGVKGYLPDDFLMKVDTGTMYASIESRAPFLDNRLIEFTSKLKPEILMPNGQEKLLLKKICEKYLPKEIVYKKKTGFRIPVRDYFNGKWSELLKTYINEGISSDLGIINREGCLQLINWYTKSKPSQMEKLLFSMLVLEIWIRVFYLRKEIKTIEL